MWLTCLLKLKIKFPKKNDIERMLQKHLVSDWTQKNLCYQRRIEIFKELFSDYRWYFYSASCKYFYKIHLDLSPRCQIR